MGATLLALLKALPAVLALLPDILALIKEAQDKQAGGTSLASAVLRKAVADIQAARAVEEAAERDHLEKKDDTAFDPSFRRD